MDTQGYKEVDKMVWVKGRDRKRRENEVYGTDTGLDNRP